MDAGTDIYDNVHSANFRMCKPIQKSPTHVCNMVVSMAFYICIRILLFLLSVHKYRHFRMDLDGMDLLSLKWNKRIQLGSILPRIQNIPSKPEKVPTFENS